MQRCAVPVRKFIFLLWEIAIYGFQVSADLYFVTNINKILLKTSQTLFGLHFEKHKTFQLITAHVFSYFTYCHCIDVADLHYTVQFENLLKCQSVAERFFTKPRFAKLFTVPRQIAQRNCTTKLRNQTTMQICSLFWDTTWISAPH